MTRMPRVTAKQVLTALEHDGWAVARQGKGSHLVLRHPAKPGIIPIPMHAGVMVKAGTLNSILRQAGLTIDGFRRLL